MFKQWKLIFAEAIIQEKKPTKNMPEELILNLKNYKVKCVICFET